MPVGTAGSIKAVHQRELEQDIDAKIIHLPGFLDLKSAINAIVHPMNAIKVLLSVRS